MARVGILGGTFNPPHIGHLVCAASAREQLGLDHVVLMPVFVPPHKTVTDDPGPQERLELCRLAVADDPGLRVSALEVERGGPSYTVETLRALQDARPEDERWFIVGGDMAQSLPTWREPEGVLALATLAVAEREGITRQDVLDRVAGLAGAAERVRFFDVPRMDLSSSLLRRRLAEGRTVRHLVPAAVERRIDERGFYRRNPYPGG
ncbi:nicotinate (nicotinamide) nucleotide adenylyltransferase [Conexibacter sp. W3-3-2]|uniref:Probable nicotinate-nucleotide adenylyltransferase n=1 Tax=Paraconexibacter algicola TaxID=2133960 RepID=A0A2T4UEQ5_9ACTN|nr:MULTISPECIES: nicotinate-nucleotide adenylyltransferase [Solirubrobacterales]MTD42796.1 nicotinate (nicotinamide) nucleotide adenylyltransferase [Conexibacter sp. W3-3-2]PTL56268.1 nicotinate (nicotinamide) nucleotide adenylyltransferase [Paraconexibacter algicola]